MLIQDGGDGRNQDSGPYGSPRCGQPKTPLRGSRSARLRLPKPPPATTPNTIMNGIASRCCGS
jgi:hypothetical protein